MNNNDKCPLISQTQFFSWILKFTALHISWLRCCIENWIRGRLTS